MHDSRNPYAAPKSALRTKRQLVGRRTRFWIRHLYVSFVLSGVWFFIGGAISIGGSRHEAAIDGIGLMLCALYLCVSLSGFLITGFSFSRGESR